jgi:hypothetical protein
MNGRNGAPDWQPEVVGFDTWSRILTWIHRVHVVPTLREDASLLDAEYRKPLKKHWEPWGGRWMSRRKDADLSRELSLFVKKKAEPERISLLTSALASLLVLSPLLWITSAQIKSLRVEVPELGDEDDFVFHKAFQDAVRVTLARLEAACKGVLRYKTALTPEQTAQLLALLTEAVALYTPRATYWKPFPMLGVLNLLSTQRRLDSSLDPALRALQQMLPDLLTDDAKELHRLHAMEDTLRTMLARETVAS